MRSHLTVLLTLFALPTLAAPVELKPKSKIDAVTVYRSSARVTRLVTTDVVAGDTRLVLDGLPFHLAEDTIRVQGSGSAQPKVYGVSVETFHHEQSIGEDVRALEQKLQALQLQDRELAGKIDTARAREAFVHSLKATYSEDRSKNLPVRAVDVKELNAMADFVAAQLALVGDQVRQATVAREELVKKVKATQAELAKIQSKANVQTKAITLELRAEKSGSLALEVSYVVPSASWGPVYDARLDTKKQQVTLGLFASIQQSTGESWNDVKLAVSTAEPHRNLYVPELHPLYLNPVQSYGYDSRPRGQAAPAPRMESTARVSSKSDSSDDEQEEQYALELPAATLAQGLLATTFTTPRRESIEGTGKPRKAFLGSFPLKTEMIRSTAPVIDAQVFLTAKGTNSTATPVLGGSANVFLDEEFLGRVAIAPTPVGGELKLAFGADDRVKVERKVERFHETAGVFTKDDIYRYRVRTTLKNLYPHEISVTTLEQVPVSRDESITVKILEASTKPSEKEDPNKPGVRSYQLKIKPQTEAVIVLEYEVRAPKGKVVANF